MRAGSTSVRFAAVALTLAVITAAAGAQSAGRRWWERYQNGLDAFNQGHWSEAVTELEVAVALEPKQGANKRTEGVYTKDYFPYYYLCVAYLKQQNLPRSEENLKKARDSGLGKLSPELTNELKKVETDLRAAKAAPATQAPAPQPPAPAPQPPPVVETKPPASSSSSAAKPTPVPPPASPPAAPKAPPPAPKTPPTRDALLAYLQGDVDHAIALLEPAVGDKGYDAASRTDMHAYLGVAYANRALLATAADEKSQWMTKAIAEFRSALAAKPGYQLSQQIVAPKILDLFDEAKRR